MTSDEQLALWAKGESIHNTDRNECCPDFSCCQPELLASQEIRDKFKTAHEAGDDKTTWAMLGMFLSAAITLAAPGKKVYIAGEEAGNA